MFCLILLVLLFSRRRYWGGYGYPHAGYGGYGYGNYGYGGTYGYPYGAYNPYYHHHREPHFGGYRPYGYW